MKPLRLDENGIPILSRVDIEERVERFIEYFDNSCLKEPRLTPIASICNVLSEKHNVKFVFNAELGETKEGYKYRGRFHIPSTTIYIDKSLGDGGPRFNFTLAHELGHFVFHRKINIAAISNEKEEISDTSRELVLDQIQGGNSRAWLEWQANKFASSLLMPRSTVQTAVISKQKEMGINRNLGKIFLDRGHGSYTDYKEQMDHLAFIYQSSKASLRIRLRELGILFEPDNQNDDGRNGPNHLSRYLVEVIENMDKNHG